MAAMDGLSAALASRLETLSRILGCSGSSSGRFEPRFHSSASMHPEGGRSLLPLSEEPGSGGSNARPGPSFSRLTSMVLHTGLGESTQLRRVRPRRPEGAHRDRRMRASAVVAGPNLSSKGGS